MEKEGIKEKYLKHTVEKKKVRELKESTHLSSIMTCSKFQFAYKSARSDLFY